jgi:hypothetical protein
MKENSSCSLHHTIDTRSINNDEIELRRSIIYKGGNDKNISSRFFNLENKP